MNNSVFLGYQKIAENLGLPADGCLVSGKTGYITITLPCCGKQREVSTSNLRRGYVLCNTPGCAYEGRRPTQQLIDLHKSGQTLPAPSRSVQNNVELIYEVLHNLIDIIETIVGTDMVSDVREKLQAQGNNYDG